MTRRRLVITRSRVLKQLELDRRELEALEQLQIVVPVRRKGREPGYRPEDVEQLRVYRTLIAELGVNSAGAEIILRLRSQLLQLHARLAGLLSRMQGQGMLDEFRRLLAALDGKVRPQKL